MKYTFKKIETGNIPWQNIEACQDAVVFKTKAWMEFLESAYGVEPFVVEISLRETIIGWFVGGRFRRFGFTIIGSPFEGWTTSYQGISVVNEISRSERVAIYKELSTYCLKKYCLMIQFTDWNLDFDDVNGTFKYLDKNESYWLDITPDADTLFKSFSRSSAQYSIHRAEKLGVVVKRPDDIASYAREYYNQLMDVFAKQGLKPTYSEKTVFEMFKALDRDNKLVMLEALHPDTKEPIACIIFLMHNKMAFYWGASSYRTYQKMRPNELLMFEAIKKIKEEGCEILEMEGIRPYKEKYNPIRYAKPKIIVARLSIIISMKNAAKKCYYSVRNLKARLKNG